MIETGFIKARFIYEFTGVPSEENVAIICRRATTVRGPFYLVQGFLARYYSPPPRYASPVLVASSVSVNGETAFRPVPMNMRTISK